jgi:hypothetical protein
LNSLALQSAIAIVADLETFYLQIKTATTSLLERELDLMVYELYGLNEEEIGVIEEDLKIDGW